MEKDAWAPLILLDGGQWLVVNKRCGEAVEGAAAGMVSLPRFFLEQGEKETAAVHRLDVPVSGCVLFARSPRCAAFLSRAFAEGRVEKRYWAVVEAPLPEAASLPEAGELVHWLARRGNKSVAYSAPGPGRQEARLRYRVGGWGRNKKYLFLEIELLTGRHHQIRAQLAARGLCVKGDLKYGARRSERGGGIRLHARALTFPTPEGPAAHVVAPPPAPDALWDACAAVFPCRPTRTGAGRGE